MNEEFNKWVKADKTARLLSNGTLHQLELAWLESARRADRKAREECAGICGRVWVQQAEGIAAARSCQEAIRATIKEE